jgi:hypothetical protein
MAEWRTEDHHTLKPNLEPRVRTPYIMATAQLFVRFHIPDATLIPCKQHLLINDALSSRTLALPRACLAFPTGLHLTHRVAAVIRRTLGVVTLSKSLLPSKPKLLILLLPLSRAIALRSSVCLVLCGGRGGVFERDIERIGFVCCEVCALTFCILLASNCTPTHLWERCLLLFSV